MEARVARNGAPPPVEVLIVGGGIIGAAIANELAGRGMETRLLERNLEVGRECSFGSAGLLVPSHAAPLATPRAILDAMRWMFDRRSPFTIRPAAHPALLAWLGRFLLAARPARVKRSLELMRDLSLDSMAWYDSFVADEAGRDATVEMRGCLNVYETEREFRLGRREAELLASDGLRPRVLTGSELRGFEAALTAEVAGGIFYERDGHCDSYALTRALADSALVRGATISTDCEVLSLERSGEAVTAKTTQGVVRARRVVVAAGAWTPDLARQLGCRVPIRGGKGYHVDMDGGPALERPLFLKGEKVTLTPLRGRVRLTGALELNGSAATVSERRLDAIFAGARRWVPALGEARVSGVWRGLRPCPPDGMPIVGRTRDPNVLVASGHCMMGVTLAPVTAQIVGELLAGEQPSYDLEPLTPLRFS